MVNMDWDPEEMLLPVEQRDQEEAAETWYYHPVQAQNRQLVAENLQLKKLLRENGISWDPRLELNPDDNTRGTWFSQKIRTRSSTGSKGLPQNKRRLPVLPTEIQLYILEYSLTSKYPIIDPLWKLSKESMTAAEKSLGNQIAIGFLATCKAYLVEGRRFLWANNRFVFTNHHALRNFSSLGLEYRKSIKQVTLRIVARYYDDEVRKHPAPFPSSEYADDKMINLKVIPRIKEQNLARRGFRSYTWNQIIDFLEALRPPFDPDHRRGQTRPRLLPDLERLRIDFVNFPDSYLSVPTGTVLHDLASHDLGSTLNELQLTGLPNCAWGQEVISQLSGMLRDDGLLLRSDATFYSSQTQLRPMEERRRWDPAWYPKVIRAWKLLADEYVFGTLETALQRQDPQRHAQPGSRIMRPAPEEEGHPESMWQRRRTIFKRVPISQRSEERVWNEFDRLTGHLLEEEDYNSDDDDYDPNEHVCPGCGVMHAPFGDH